MVDSNLFYWVCCEIFKINAREIQLIWLTNFDMILNQILNFMAERLHTFFFAFSSESLLFLSIENLNHTFLCAHLNDILK